MAFSLSLVQAARKYKVSKPTILSAIRKGKIPALIIEKPHLRVTPKDMVAFVATIPEWRRVNGRKGGLARVANLRNGRKTSTRAPKTRSAGARPQSPAKSESTPAAEVG
jgi:hypothetical protein